MLVLSKLHQTLSTLCLDASKFQEVIDLACQGLNRLLGWNVAVLLYICKNDGALIVVKKLYIHMCAARDMPPLKREGNIPVEPILYLANTI